MTNQKKKMVLEIRNLSQSTEQGLIRADVTPVTCREKVLILFQSDVQVFRVCF